MIRMSKLTDYAIVLLAHLARSDRTLTAQELADPPDARRLGDADRPGELDVGHPGVGDEGVDDGTIDLVDRSRTAGGRARGQRVSVLRHVVTVAGCPRRFRAIAPEGARIPRDSGAVPADCRH